LCPFAEFGIEIAHNQTVRTATEDERYPGGDKQRECEISGARNQQSGNKRRE
jgi:hypothetical protein